MKVVLSLGSNIGDKLNNLEQAIFLISKKWQILERSRIFESEAVDYTDQPSFYNMAIIIEVAIGNPSQIMHELLSIESELGRTRVIQKGPRLIDIDIIFWEDKFIDLPNLKIPHSAWQNRSFVVLPIQDLKYSKVLEQHFVFPTEFTTPATPIAEQ